MYLYYKDYNAAFMLLIGVWYVCLASTVGHEGHHGSASKYPIVNQLFRLGYNIIGRTCRLYY
jgi:fatty acid desaturase